jgi:transcriptional regulator with XRE-family HTH domain
MSCSPVCAKLAAMATQSKPRPHTQKLAALGQAIMLVIDEKRLSQRKVADLSGLDFRQVNDFALGKGNPTYRNLQRLCDGLGVSLGELTVRSEKLLEEGSGGEGQDSGREGRSGQSG